MPRSKNIHKSMLLRGVVLTPPALNRADIEATKGRANKSGRSHGGAPLRSDSGNGRGRGGQIDYADSRPYPHPAHSNPSFPTQGAPGNYRGGPPPPPPMRGWAPPPPSFGNSPYGYPPPPSNFGYVQPLPPPPPHGHHNNFHDGNYRNQFPINHSNNNYQGPPPDGRYNGQNERNGR